MDVIYFSETMDVIYFSETMDVIYFIETSRCKTVFTDKSHLCSVFLTWNHLDSF
jgi:hypothetical protein